MTGCKNILIIEDDQYIREMMQDALEIQGYHVVAACDGRQAMETLQRLGAAGTLPCVLLLDLMMPIMNGWQFLDFQRTHPEFSKIPVVVVSAYTESARSVRPEAVVTKPIQLNQLVNAVQAFCA